MSVLNPLSGVNAMKLKLYVLCLLAIGMGALTACSPGSGGDDDETLKGYRGSYYQDMDYDYDSSEYQSYDFE